MIHPKYDDIEMWKAVPGYEGFYEVSSWGRIRSVDKVIIRRRVNRRQSIKGKLLNPNKNDKGYNRIRLQAEGQRSKTFRMARLVALLFVPNPDNLPEVNHDDLNKDNDHYKNLSWSTRMDNMRHAFENRVIRRYKNELNVASKKVAQYDMAGKLIKLWPSMAEAKRSGFQASGICKVCKGEVKQHAGYIWKYA